MEKCSKRHVRQTERHQHEGHIRNKGAQSVRDRAH